jgi:hypothetical protein
VVKRVIVFSSHSIYAEGVVSRLRQHPLGGEIHFIDAQDDDYIQKVVELQPSVVILDAIQGSEIDSCLFCTLLSEFPELTIIRLKVQERDVQVVKSSQCVVESVQDLIDLIGEKNAV